MHNPLIQSLGTSIKNRRKFLKLTQEELSEIGNLSLRSLIDLENGKGNPTLIQVHKILEALGLDLGVIGRKENEK